MLGLPEEAYFDATYNSEDADGTTKGSVLFVDICHV